MRINEKYIAICNNKRYLLPSQVTQHLQKARILKSMTVYSCTTDVAVSYRTVQSQHVLLHKIGYRNSIFV